jgi:hypothetical protein
MDAEDSFEYVSKAEAQAFHDNGDSNATTMDGEHSIVLMGKDNVPPLEDGYVSLMEDVESLNSDDTVTLDPAEVYVDPDILLLSTDAVFSMIEAVVRQIDRLRERRPVSALENISKTCYRLFDQASTLENVALLRISSNSKATIIRLAPRYLKWTRNLQQCLAELNSKIGLLLSTSPLPSDLEIGEDSIVLRDTDDAGLGEGTLTNIQINCKLDWQEYQSRLDTLKASMDAWKPIPKL